jgi:hypothetical protein
VSLSTELRYLTGGAVAEAHVLQKWQAALRQPATVAAVLAHGAGRRGPRYTVSYEYRDLAGQVRQGFASFSKDDWDELRPGDALEIEYLTADPNTSRPLSTLRVALWIGLALEAVGCLTLIGGLTLLGRRWTAIKGQVQLIATGQPVLGLIDEVSTLGKKNDPCVVLRYRYLVPDGVWTPKVRTGLSAPVAADPQRWRVGGPILVLVDPDAPDRHAADLFHARPEDMERLCRTDAAG